MDARRRLYAARSSLILGSLMLGFALAAAAPSAWAGSIRSGEELIQVMTLTTRTRASWYGTGFHGQASASGRIFNQAARTAAHRTLPFGTKVEVTNLRNGRKLTVVVTDRGPFVAGRGIDISAGAASSLGFQDRGVAAVRMAVRLPRSRGLSLIGPSSMYILWVPPRRGAFAAEPVILTSRGDRAPVALEPSFIRRAITATKDQAIWQ